MHPSTGFPKPRASALRSIAVDFVTATSNICHHRPMVEVLIGIPIGFLLWFFVRYGVLGFYTIGPNERAVISTFGRAQRTGLSTLEDPLAMALRADERERTSGP